MHMKICSTINHCTPPQMERKCYIKILYAPEYRKQIQDQINIFPIRKERDKTNWHIKYCHKIMIFGIPENRYLIIEGKCMKSNPFKDGNKPIPWPINRGLIQAIKFIRSHRHSKSLATSLAK